MKSINRLFLFDINSKKAKNQNKKTEFLPILAQITISTARWQRVVEMEES
jgi:hypothetical protein